MDDEFAAFVAAHRAGLFRLVRSRMPRDEDAEDITQEAFLRAWRRRGRFMNEEHRRNFTYRVAAQLIIDHYRVRGNQVVTLERVPEDALGVVPGPAELVERAHDSQQLVDVLAGLPEPQRRLLVDCDVLDLSPEEIAARHHGSGTALRSRRYRARAAFRRRLMECLGIPALITAVWRKLFALSRSPAQRTHAAVTSASGYSYTLGVAVTAASMVIGPFGAVPMRSRPPATVAVHNGLGSTAAVSRQARPIVGPRVNTVALSRRGLEALPRHPKSGAIGASAERKAVPIPPLPKTPGARVCAGNRCVSSPAEPADPGDEIYVDAPQPVGHVGVKQNEVPVCDKGLPSIGPAGCRHVG